MTRPNTLARSGLGETTMATGARRPAPARIGAGPEPIKTLSVDSGGLEPRSRSRPARDAAPTIATTPALTSMCWPWSTSSLGPLLRIQTEALDSPDFVEIGAKPTREDGQRGRRNGGGSPWVPCHLARPRPMWTT